MLDQLINYTDVPYCRVNRDLDITLLQFFTLTYGGDSLVNHIFHRFGVLQALRLGKSLSKKSLYNMHPAGKLTWEKVKSCGLTDFDSDIEYLPQLVNEALLVLIHIVTELPPPPPTDTNTDRTDSSLKRELLHYLASSPATFSQLQVVGLFVHLRYEIQSLSVSIYILCESFFLSGLCQLYSFT